MAQDHLAQLFTKAQITDVITELFIATDQRNWNRIHELMTETVRFDMTSVVGGKAVDTSADAITAGWETALKPLKAVHHQIGNFTIRLEEDGRAEVTCYGIAYHYLPNASGHNTRVFVGDYAFGLKKVSGNWKISDFTFKLKFIDGNPDLEHTEKA